MNELERLALNLITHRGFKKGELAVIGCYTPNKQGKSWVEKAIQEQLATELSKKQLTYCGYIIDDFKAWMPRTKLLQSKSKQSRLVRVVIKGLY